MILNVMLFFPFLLCYSGIGFGEEDWTAKERNGLYHLKLSQKTSNNLSLPFLSSSNKDTIWLHHLRLGHPSFRVLKVMFPYLFQGSDIS